ncbi:MAG: cupin domain-containing protein [Gammaproteobacteria bacterium]|jgi:predicted cupin superfamily sugar epimerase|nr:cupin domain-containing protein [Gammaproteobacteria bacterium]
MNKQTLIKTLNLEPHPSESGYFKRTYTSPLNVHSPAGVRPSLSSIYYLLSDDSPVGFLHKNRSDIIHYFHGGGAIRYWIIHPEGRLETATLGSDLAQGQTFQLTVKGGCWKASELISGEYGLISEAVSPGFDYGDMELADAADMRRRFPALFEAIAAYISPA